MRVTGPRYVWNLKRFHEPNRKCGQRWSIDAKTGEKKKAGLLRDHTCGIRNGRYLFIYQKTPTVMPDERTVKNLR